MKAAAAAGDSVLVHCNSGAYRSSSVVAGFMMLAQKKRFDEVMPTSATVVLRMLSSKSRADTEMSKHTVTATDQRTQ